MKKYIVIFFFLSKCIYSAFAQNNEAFDPSLSRLNSLELLNNYIDSLKVARNIPGNSKEEVELVNEVIENRFHHGNEKNAGYCHYAPDENFLAYLAGKYIRYDLSAIVIPDDILKYEYAACSQQSMIMMRILKDRGYKVRKLELVAHFVPEVLYENTWHFYDPDMEPLIQGVEHDSLELLLKNGSLTKAYARSLPPDGVEYVFNKMVPGETNEIPGKNAMIFHKITKFLSNYYYVIFVCVIGILFFVWNKRSKTKSEYMNNSGKVKILV